MTAATVEAPPVAAEDNVDFAFGLLLERRRILDLLDEHGRSERPDIEVIGIGMANIGRALSQAADRCTEVLSTHPWAPLYEATRESDRELILRGKKLCSLYNLEATKQCQAEHIAPYLTDDILGPRTFVSPTTVQMLIFDRSSVVLEGPEIRGERSAIAVSELRTVGVALDYWRRQKAIAVPASDVIAADPLLRFTPRQRQVAALLADDLTDVVIATKLGMSLRTVQTEAAAIMRLLGVRSRFGAGLRLGELRFERMSGA